MMTIIDERKNTPETLPPSAGVVETAQKPKESWLGETTPGAIMKSISEFYGDHLLPIINHDIPNKILKNIVPLAYQQQLNLGGYFSIVADKKTNLRLTFKNNRQATLREQRLLTYAYLWASITNINTVHFTGEILGILEGHETPTPRQCKEALKNGRDDSEGLRGIDYSYKYKDKKTGEHEGAGSLVGWKSDEPPGTRRRGKGTKGETKGTRSGVLTLTLPEDFSGRGGIFPKTALSVNLRHNPYGIVLAQAICLHKVMNMGKPNEDIIPFRTLAAVCSGIPSCTASVNPSPKREVYDTFIEPIIRDLKPHEKLLTVKPITKSGDWRGDTDEKGKKHPIKYSELAALLCKVEWAHNLPDIGLLVGKRSRKTATDTAKKGRSRAKRPTKDI